MPLVEPLEGVKLCQGHLVYHLTMWLCHFLVANKNQMLDKIVDGEQERMYVLFMHSAWLHLATAILQLVQTELKRRKWLTFASICELAIYPLSFYPVLYSSYNLGFIIQDMQKASGNGNDIWFIIRDIHKASGVEVWFILETFLFVSQVFAGIAFMIVSKCYKLHSIGNQNKADRAHHKKGADFLRYMKLEAYNFVFHGSFMIMNCFAIYINSLSSNQKPLFECACIIMFAAHALILVVMTFQMHHEKSGESKRILPIDMSKIQIGLLLLALAAYLLTVVIWNFTAIKSSQLIDIWV